MLDDLRAWEATRGPEAPELLVVVTGSEQDGREMGLRSPILLDPDFSVVWTFGANGTPMAGPGRRRRANRRPSRGRRRAVFELAGRGTQAHARD